MRAIATATRSTSGGIFLAVVTFIYTALCTFEVISMFTNAVMHAIASGSILLGSIVVSPVLIHIVICRRGLS